MLDIREQDHLARKILPIIYVLDTSGGMAGARIAAVNTAMSEAMDVFKNVADKIPTAELKIGVLRFASGAEWITSNGFVYVRDYSWNDLEAGGLSDFGSGLDQLDEKLSRKEFMDSDYGYKVPVIIFMSDGEPTDDYESALKRLEENNKWYKIACKIAIALGNGANKEILAKVAGSSEAVIEVDDVDVLKKLIKVISTTIIEVISNSIHESILERIRTNMGDDVGDDFTRGCKDVENVYIRGCDEGISDEYELLTPIIDEGNPWGTQWD